MMMQTPPTTSTVLQLEAMSQQTLAITLRAYMCVCVSVRREGSSCDTLMEKLGAGLCSILSASFPGRVYSRANVRHLTPQDIETWGESLPGPFYHASDIKGRENCRKSSFTSRD